MGYLEQFARNRRGKEKTEVLTARLPAALYSRFKGHCDELGLSISEAVYLLVQHEMESVGTTLNCKNNDSSKLDEYKNSDDIFGTMASLNTETTINVVAENTDVVIAKQNVSKVDTKRFTTKQWVVDGKLPCPLCNQWVKHSNFARHAKQHGSNTHDIFTNDGYLKQVDKMIQIRGKQ